MENVFVPFFLRDADVYGRPLPEDGIFRMGGMSGKLENSGGYVFDGGTMTESVLLS